MTKRGPFMLACPPHPCGVGAFPAPGSYRRSRTPSCGPGQGSCTSSGRSWERRYQGAGPPEAWLRGWGWERAVPARGSHHPDHTEGDSFPRTQPLPAGPLNRNCGKNSSEGEEEHLLIPPRLLPEGLQSPQGKWPALPPPGCPGLPPTPMAVAPPWPGSRSPELPAGPLRRNE